MDSHSLICLSVATPALELNLPLWQQLPGISSVTMLFASSQMGKKTWMGSCTKAPAEDARELVLQYIFQAAPCFVSLLHQTGLELARPTA